MEPKQKQIIVLVVVVGLVVGAGVIGFMMMSSTMGGLFTGSISGLGAIQKEGLKGTAPMMSLPFESSAASADSANDSDDMDQTALGAQISELKKVKRDVK